MDYKQKEIFMKNVAAVLLLLATFEGTQAQFLGGIFSQGSTELKNNAAQILALQALGTTSQEGYEIVDNGLTDIGNIHGAEYALHQQYFTSLSTVNPKIAAMPETNEIRSIIPTITTALSTEINSWISSTGLTLSELTAMRTLNSNLTQLGQSELGVLQTLLTSGELAMSDADRIHAIRELDKAVHEQYAFVAQICAETDLLIANRKKP